MRVPKQYFGWTGDGAGFDGGKSLSIISSRYGKMIKRIQNTIIQALTDAINLMLVDRNLKAYVNEFNIRMLSPTTQEELDRRENMASKVQLTSDIMNMLSDISEPQQRLKILKSLLSNILTNGDVITIIQEEIDKLEAETEASDSSSDTEEESIEEIGDSGDFDLSSDDQDFNSSFESDDENKLDLDFDSDIVSDEEIEAAETIEPATDMNLPTGDDLGIDLTQNL